MRVIFPADRDVSKTDRCLQSSQDKRGALLEQGLVEGENYDASWSSVLVVWRDNGTTKLAGAFILWSRIGLNVEMDDRNATKQ